METLFVGKNAVFLPETESTNSYATELLKNVNLPEGSIIHTANQTKGKGQRGSLWRSEPASNLAVSVVLRPGFLAINKQFYLYKVAALACYDTIAHLLNSSQFDIKIKWPNDILVNKQKIAGILIENNIQNNRVNWCVMGVGINLNQEDFEGLPNANSVKKLLNQPVSVDKTLAYLCQRIEKHYLALMSNKLDAIQAEYLTHFYGLNCLMNFEIGGTLKQLRVLGTGKSGLLMLEDHDKQVLELDVKEAKWVV